MPQSLRKNTNNGFLQNLGNWFAIQSVFNNIPFKTGNPMVAADEDITITESGTYNISAGINVFIEAEGESIFNYNTSEVSSVQNIITLNEVDNPQTTTVNGFTSEIVNSTVTTEVQQGYGGLLGAALLISVAPLGITAMPALVIVAVLLSDNETGTIPSTQIIATNQLAVEQTIYLVNVSVSSIQEDNFIFADSNHGGGNNDDIVDQAWFLPTVIVGSAAVCAGAVATYFYGGFPETNGLLSNAA